MRFVTNEALELQQDLRQKQLGTVQGIESSNKKRVVNPLPSNASGPMVDMKEKDSIVDESNGTGLNLSFTSKEDRGAEAG